MAAPSVGTFVRVLAGDENHGRLAVIVKPRLSDPQLHDSEVWVELAGDGPFSGVYRTFYDVDDLRVADELTRHE